MMYDDVLPDESDLMRRNMQLSEHLNHACDEIKSLQKENKKLKELLKQLDYNHIEKRIIDIQIEFDFTDPKYRNMQPTDSKTVEQNLYIDLWNRFNENEGFKKLTVKCTDVTDKLEKLNEKDKD
mgnify:CR=1 FL=1